MKRPAIHSLLAAGLIVAVIAIVNSSFSASRRLDDCADLDAFLDADLIAVPSGGIEPEGAPGPRRRATLNGFVQPRSPLDNLMAFSVRRAHVLTLSLIRPTRAVPGPKEPDVLEQVELEVGDVILPVTFAKETEIGDEGFVAYTYALGREPLASPFWARVRSAHEAFSSGLRPMTLFVVSGKAHRTRLAEERQRSLDWIAAAWEHYLKTCHPS